MVKCIPIGFVIGVRAGAVLVREPAEGVIRRRDRIPREAGVAAAVPVCVIAVGFLLEVRRALRGGDPGDKVRRVVGIALLYAVAVVYERRAADGVIRVARADASAAHGGKPAERIVSVARAHAADARRKRVTRYVVGIRLCDAAFILRNEPAERVIGIADAVAALRLADEAAVLGVEIKLLYNFSLLWKQVRSHLPTLPQRFFSNFLPLPFPLQALHIHNL